MSGKAAMVTAVFRDRLKAQAAFDDLVDRGYQTDEINVLMSEATRKAHFGWREEALQENAIQAGTKGLEGVGMGGGIGTAVGATIGAVLAAGTSVAIPGLGLILAGPIVGALAGAGAGALTGGTLGGLIGLGVTESNAEAYHEALRTGGVVLGVVPRSKGDVDDLQKVFTKHHGENVCYC